ncbi:kinase-like protein [Amniculicola lignicola CBS 123094]|uniref:non-specific serine/threonine protein kinase n=1 Tax=Amniculicola lignicola CBS 123094 TaxID=1392246 RepID=A0A6A5WZM5_9PLEO|nr:kinase-like protein [Amniculicola lignicola CBS 123094]
MTESTDVALVDEYSFACNSSSPNNFTVIRGLGFCCVNKTACRVLVRSNNTGQLLVEKRFALSEEVHKAANLEAELLRKLVDQPAITQLLGHCMDDSSPLTGSIFYEYGPLGTLAQLIHQNGICRQWIPEYFLWNVLSQIGAALAYCHNGPPGSDQPWRPIIHCDVHQDKISIFRNEEGYYILKLGGFEHADYLPESGFIRKHIQADVVVPPEGEFYSQRTDVYQLGATIVCMCQLEGELQTSRDIRESYSSDLRWFVKRCMEDDREPQYRNLSKDIVDKVNDAHEHLRRNNWNFERGFLNLQQEFL